MARDVLVKDHQSAPLVEYLLAQDFEVEEISDSVIKITRENELPIFLNIGEFSIFFEVDLGNVSDFASKELYFELLDLNTEILPVSIGVDSTNKADPRLVLVESRETNNLDSNEILSVISALELATDKVEESLKKYMNA